MRGLAWGRSSRDGIDREMELTATMHDLGMKVVSLGARCAQTVSRGRAFTRRDWSDLHVASQIDVVICDLDSEGLHVSVLK